MTACAIEFTLRSAGSRAANRFVRGTTVVICLSLSGSALGPKTVNAQEAPDVAIDSLATKGLPLEPEREINFQTDEGSWMSVDLSPDGSTLVFDLLGDLYTLPIGGGTATPLLTGPAFEAQPRFSPDGSEILFVSDRSGGQNLWALRTDRSDTTQITKGNDFLYTSPEWGPRWRVHRRLAYLQPTRWRR